MDNQEDCRPQREIVYVPSSVYGLGTENEIDLLDLGLILWRSKWFVFGLTVACTFIAFVYSFFVLTPQYRATADIQVNAESQSVILSYVTSNRFHKKLISRYDLLPMFFEARWDADKQKWAKSGKAQAPTAEAVLARQDFPLQASVKDNDRLISLSWTGEDPENCSRMLEHVLTELRNYLNQDYVHPAQTRVQSLQANVQDLLELAQASGGMGQVALAAIAGLQTRMAELRDDILQSRQFSVINEPITPQEPFEPNKKLIVGLAFVTGLFVAIFLVFLAKGIRSARKRMEEKGVR